MRNWVRVTFNQGVRDQVCPDYLADHVSADHCSRYGAREIRRHEHPGLYLQAWPYGVGSGALQLYIHPEYGQVEVYENDVEYVFSRWYKTRQYDTLHMKQYPTHIENLIIPNELHAMVGTWLYNRKHELERNE